MVTDCPTRRKQGVQVVGDFTLKVREASQI